MLPLSFVEAKKPDFGFIERCLGSSADENQWTNFGPVSRALEDRVSELLNLPDSKACVTCASATAGLHALVNCFEYIQRRRLRWVVSAFTFQCQNQGALSDSIVVDCDSEGFLDISAVAHLSPDEYDGIIYTQLFGTPRDSSEIAAFATKHGKLLVFDSAASFYSGARDGLLGPQGDASVFSFHHTKPSGFGEGGAVVIAKNLEELFRSAINFGLSYGKNTGPLSMNGKMSDVSAAFILDRLRSVHSIRDRYQQQYSRIRSLAAEFGFAPLINCEDVKDIFPGHLPILADTNVELEQLANGLFVCAKYYSPLKDRNMASDLYRRIFSIPCHTNVADVEARQIQDFFRHIKK